MNPNKHVSLNLTLRGLGESPTLAMSEKCRAMREQGHEVFNMSIGQSPFPIPTPVVAALKMYAREKTYLPVRGLPELRAAVAEYHRNHDEVSLSGDNILIGPGSKMLMFLLQMSFYGEIIIPTPCWVTYAPQAKLLGREVQFIDTGFEDRWHFTAEKLEALCQGEQDTYRPRIVVLNYPGNPDGGTYTIEEMRAIADVAREYEVILLSDEIYGELDHSGNHISVARFYPEGTVISSGLSKWSAAAGWRLGTFAFPDSLDWLLNAMADAASQTYTSVCSPVQWAAITAFKGGVKIERYLWHVRRIFRALSNRCADMLRDAGAMLHDPEGAFYLFPDFSHLADTLERRGITTSAELTDAILEKKHVATIPGVSFSRPKNELTLRISYTNFDGSTALAASEAIPLDEDLPDGFIEEYCAPAVRGVAKVCEFISESQ